MTAAITTLTVHLSLEDHHSIHEMASAIGQKPSAYLSGLVSLHAAKIQLRLIFAAKGMADPLGQDNGGLVASHPHSHSASPAGIPPPVPHPVVPPAPTIPLRITLPVSVINVLRASSVDGKAETAVRVVAHGEAVECRRHRRLAVEQALSSG